jgi:5-(carboxyamino)imidazole ribonucleotide synthase
MSDADRSSLASWTVNRLNPASAQARPRVGMVGGGQLARMSAAPAAALGIDFAVLATGEDESAAQVVRRVILGHHDDPQALARLAEAADVMTFDHEHVPPDLLENLLAQGVSVRPGPAALRHAQDKWHMRQALSDLAAPVPAWQRVEGVGDVVQFAQEHDWPVVMKVSRGGYDGRGVWVVDDDNQAAAIMQETPLVAEAVWLVEQYLPFEMEISAQVARSPHGQAVAYPVVQTIQVNGMCAEVIAPAPGLTDELATSATELALRLAKELDVVGMLAVELFVVDGRIVVNELAMRPHNSGHWSIEGAVTSQFENHLRAVMDWPLGDPRAVAKFAVMVNVIGPEHPIPPLHEAFRHVMARDPGLHVHLYGKSIRPRRKLGHVTALGDDLDEVRARAHHGADYLMGVIDE